MEMILGEIERALKARLYYLAVVLSLTVPDICSALESPTGETTGPQFKAWYGANLALRYPFLTDQDMYMLRCGVVHQGRLGHPKSQYGRVIFVVPSTRLIHNVIINDSLNLDAGAFCRDVILAARVWFRAAKTDAVVQANLAQLVQFRPNGLSPYIVGTPVIA